MSDPKLPAAPESTAYHPSSGERPPPAVAHGEAVFPDGAESSDDAPTIISKKLGARKGGLGPSGEGIVGGSLRGRTLAHFELIEPIGVGGMAAVIRARDRQLDRPVALKILPPEMAVDAENVARFHQEARAAAKLDHENIARVFFCGEDQRLHFIAFEFVEGVNLRTLLERRGRLPVREAVHYMLQIATGLAHAASRGVVHRDIKPSNIIISPNGRAKLVDMGLARNMGPQNERDLTQSGVTLGTFDYIAPEQAMDPREADVRSDIYSLGCTFYHMVTGQPPVPEGTAAKKLHHHQQVAPVDPRQLNPSIPDDVAGILRRMMAKDPKDRYQRAEHLVQHLIQVAQKLGSVADLPDGVLFVDAPLPSPPAKRPLLMAAAGVFLLGVLLIVLSLAPARSGAPRPFRPSAEAGGPRAVQGERPAALDKRKPDSPPNAAGPPVVTTEQGLRDAAKGTAAVLQLDGNPSITGRVRIDAKGDQPRVIKSSQASKPAIVRITPPASSETEGPRGGLEVHSGHVIFQDLVFEIDAEARRADALVASVLVKNAARVTFLRCTFTQTRVPSEPLFRQRAAAPVVSVAAWGGDNAESPTITFQECYFKRGEVALLVRGAARVQPTNCAFGPHLVLFDLYGDEKKGERGRLDLNDVSALLVYGPAFRLHPGAACNLDVQFSVFSCPDRNLSLQPPDLIRQADTKAPAVRFKGRRNCYHNLNALWSGNAGTRGPASTLEEFLAALHDAGGFDHESSYLDADKVSPWARAPLPVIAEDPRAAFTLNSRLPELRRGTDPGARPIGVAKCVWGLMPTLEPVPTPPAVAQRKSNEKIVDPLAEKTPGVYRTLSAAIQDAKDEDVILIRHTGPLAVNPAKLKVEQRLTIRPDGTHRPILTLAEKTVDSEALFTLYHGQLRFENLEFLLKPDLKPERADSGKPVAVVALRGNGQILFKKCAITLEQSEGGVPPLCVVALSENRGAMEMATPETKDVPEITLEKCLVRGEGDLLAVRDSRSFVLGLNGSLAVLHGSLVCVESTKPFDGTGTAKVDLNATTTYLQDHLVSLRGKSGKSLVYTEVQADNCLFAAAGSKALVRIEGPDTEDQMRRVFRWGGKGNTYSGYDKFLEQQPAGEGGVALRYDQDRWKAFANETDPDPRFVQLKFAVPDSEAAFRQAVPQQFRLKAEPGLDVRGGAPINQLPTPAAVEAAPAKSPVVPEERPEGESDGGMK